LSWLLYHAPFFLCLRKSSLRFYDVIFSLGVENLFRAGLAPFSSFGPLLNTPGLTENSFPSTQPPICAMDFFLPFAMSFSFPPVFSTCPSFSRIVFASHGARGRCGVGVFPTFFILRPFFLIFSFLLLPPLRFLCCSIPFLPGDSWSPWSNSGGIVLFLCFCLVFHFSPICWFWSFFLFPPSPLFFGDPPPPCTMSFKCPLCFLCAVGSGLFFIFPCYSLFLNFFGSFRFFFSYPRCFFLRDSLQRLSHLFSLLMDRLVPMPLFRSRQHFEHLFFGFHMGPAPFFSSLYFRVTHRG